MNSKSSEASELVFAILGSECDRKAIFSRVLEIFLAGLVSPTANAVPA